MPVKVTTQSQHSPFVSRFDWGQNSQRNQLCSPAGRAHPRWTEWGEDVREKSWNHYFPNTPSHGFSRKKICLNPLIQKDKCMTYQHARAAPHKMSSPGELTKIYIVYGFLCSKPAWDLRKNVSSYCFGNHGASGAGSIFWKIWGFYEISVKFLMGFWMDKTSKVNWCQWSWKICTDK